MPNDTFDAWVLDTFNVDVSAFTSKAPPAGPAAPKPSQAGGAEVTLGPAQISEETLGPPVGPGPGADTLYAFMAEDGSGPADKSTPTAAALNDSGRPLQANVAAILKTFMAWKHEVALIQEDEKKGGGPAALQSVKDAAGAIGKSARGSAGGGVREGTQKFFDLVKDAGKIIDEVAAQVDKCAGANYNVLAMVLKDAAQKQSRVVGANKDAVEEERRNIEEKKKQIEKYFALAEKLVQPQEWMDAAVTVGLFVDEKLAEAIFASDDKLDALKKKLEESEVKLASLEDESQLDTILGAKKDAEAELHNLDAVHKTFARLAKDLKAAQTTIIEDLGKSPATKLAAQALVRRDAISKQAAKAAAMVRAYLGEADPLLKNTVHLQERYSSYVAIVAQYGQGSPEFLAASSKTAKRNAGACQDFADYLRVTQVQGNDALEYLTKDTDKTFLAGYNDIPDALEDAVADRND